MVTTQSRSLVRKLLHARFDLACEMDSRIALLISHGRSHARSRIIVVRIEPLENSDLHNDSGFNLSFKNIIKL